MPNQNLDYWLDYFCKLNKNVVEGSDSYPDTVFAITADQISVNGLLPMEDDDSTAAEKLELFYGFGRKLAGEIAMPDFIVVSQLLVVEGSRCIMVLHGCSHTEQRGVRGFFAEVGRNWWKPWKRRICVKEDAVFGGNDPEINPAVEDLRGLVAGATSGCG
jgi:hypothetical protein